MPDRRKRYLEQLRRTSRSCTLRLAERALDAWGFVAGRAKGHTRAWNHEEITLTLHKPHGKHLDPGAVALIIKKIEQADLRQRANRRRREKPETPTDAG
jgi:predicted RNA binding protein YcfA (HicA-like mRNA interferase family)